jgi:hypothetical protein
MTRIKLIRVQDAHTRLKAGDTGTIVGESFDQIGYERLVRLDVQWDSGSTLAIYPHLDEFEVITEPSVGSSVSQ